jgi:ferredoxin--NADP+ reductase
MCDNQWSLVSFLKDHAVAHKVVEKHQLSENVFAAWIEAPLIAKARKPGQFVIVSMSGDYSERIPLTIAGADPVRGTIRLIWQRVGKSTAELSDMKVGDAIENIAGPLGKPTHIEKVGTVVCIGGGIGCAPLLPIATAMKEIGNKVISIVGARTKDLILMEEEFQKISDQMTVPTSGRRL